MDIGTCSDRAETWNTSMKAQDGAMEERKGGKDRIQREVCERRVWHAG